jgi:hypothetical protein
MFVGLKAIQFAQILQGIDSAELEISARKNAVAGGQGRRGGNALHQILMATPTYELGAIDRELA